MTRFTLVNPGGAAAATRTDRAPRVLSSASHGGRRGADSRCPSDRTLQHTACAGFLTSTAPDGSATSTATRGPDVRTAPDRLEESQQARAVVLCELRERKLRRRLDTTFTGTSAVGRIADAPEERGHATVKISTPEGRMKLITTAFEIVLTMP
jgi:hypothetical protein